MTSQSDPTSNGSREEVVIRGLNELVRAAHQWSLYGPEHPVTRAACDAAAEAFVAMISGRSHFTLTVLESGLLAEGEQLPQHPPLRQLHESLRMRRIAALVIHPQVTWDEIAALISVLGTDSAELADKGGARRALQTMGCEHIEIEEVDYSRFVPASQAQWLSLFADGQVSIHSTVEDLAGACLELAGDRLQFADKAGAGELGLPMPFPVPVAADAREADEIPLQAQIAALEDVAPEDYVAVGLAWLMQASGEAMLESPPAERKRWRDSVASRLAQLDLALQARIFRAPRQTANQAPDMLAALVADRSPQQVADLILGRPAAVVGEPSAALERILRRTLPDERKLLAVEPLLRQRLVARGMSQDSFRNVVGLLLDQIAADLAMHVGGGENWLGDFDAWSPPTGQTIEEWPDLLRSISPHAVAQARARLLVGILPYHKDAAGYLDLVGHMERCAVERAAAGDVASMLEVVCALANEVEEGEPARAPIAASALQRMASEQVAQRLRQALAEASGQERLRLLEIAAKMGNECADLLLGEVERAQEPQLRSLAVRLLAQAGERGASQVRHLLAYGSPDKAMAVAAALIEGGGDGLLSHLAAGLEHREPMVRMRLAERLGQVPGLVSEHLLIRALYDEELGVQAIAAQSLGETRARGAVYALALVAKKGPLHGRRFEVRKAAVQALGHIGSPDAVPALKELLGSHSLLFREHAQELSALAAAGLRHIPGPEAQQALAAYPGAGPSLASREAPSAVTRHHGRGGSRHD